MDVWYFLQICQEQIIKFQHYSNNPSLVNTSLPVTSDVKISYTVSDVKSGRLLEINKQKYKQNFSGFIIYTYFLSILNILHKDAKQCRYK